MAHDGVVGSAGPFVLTLPEQVQSAEHYVGDGDDVGPLVHGEREDRLQVFANVVSSTYDSKQLLEAFHQLGDGSGVISIDVLRDLLANFGDKLPPGEVNAMIGSCAYIVDGQADYLELCDAAVGLSGPSSGGEVPG